jgi:hypothetical protein
MLPSELSHFPDPLVRGAHAALARFGFGQVEEGCDAEEWSALWELLKGDVETPSAPAHSGFAELTPVQRERAVDYMEARLEADRALVACAEAHAALHRAGIGGDLVERYALAREAYEGSVERFGAARVALAAALG